MGGSKKPAGNAAPPGQAAGGKKRRSPVMPITVGVVVLLVAAALFAASGPKNVNFLDGQVSRTIATVDECAVATVALQIPDGKTSSDMALAVFDALSKTEGVGVVTVFEDAPRAEINYCQSYSTEAKLQEILAPTGFLAQ